MVSTARRTVGFWLLGLTVVALFAASSAPSPLYLVYQSRWHFSATVLTLVFASYALALLVALLTLGGLSDFVGRRKVIAGALVVEIVAMVVFAAASSVGELLVARIVQGLATGAAAGALAAGIADLAPLGRPSLGAAVNTAGPSSGLAIGALASGALVQYAPDPRTLVYIALAVVFALLLVALVLIPEVVPRRPGALASLRPRVRVPTQARAAFRTAAPVLVATWAVGGLILSLGASLAATLLGIQNHLIGGLVVTAVAGVAAVTSVLVRSRPAAPTMIWSSLVLALGTALLLVSIGLSSTLLFFLALVVAGAGFGAAFVASIGSVTSLAAPSERAELFAAVYVVSYGAFGLSAVAAGFAVSALRPPSHDDGVRSGGHRDLGRCVSAGTPAGCSAGSDRPSRRRSRSGCPRRSGSPTAVALGLS